MHEDVVERHAVLADGHHLQLHVVEHQPLVHVLAEEHLFALTEGDGVFRPHLLVAGERLVSTVIEYHAVHQHLDDRQAVVLRSGHHALRGQVHLGVYRTGEESAVGTYHQFAGIERTLHRTVGRRLGNLAELRRRRVLSFGETVNLVIEQHHVQVDVTADGVDEMVAADGERVAVARHHKDAQVGVGRLETRSDGVGTAVYAVETVCAHVIGETRRTADTGDHRETRMFHVGIGGYLRHGLLDGTQHGIVAAAGTPLNFLVAFEVRNRIFEFAHDYFSNNSLNLSTSSSFVNGSPCTLLNCSYRNCGNDIRM